MISMVAEEKKVSSLTLFVSIAMHAFLIGGAGIPFERASRDVPEEEHSVIIRIEKPPLLPEIDLMSDEKKLKEIIEAEESLPQIEINEQTEDICHDLSEEFLAVEEDSPLEIFSEKEFSEPEKKDEERGSADVEKIDIPEPDNEAMLRYQDMVKQKIESRRRYPSWARRQNMQGVSHIVFKLLPDGSASDLRLIKSSGFSILDNEALSTVGRAAPFDPMPPGFSRGYITIELEIVFKM